MLKALVFFMIFTFCFGLDVIPTTPCSSESGCRQFWNHLRIIIEVNNRIVSKFIPFDVKVDEMTKLNINANFTFGEEGSFFRIHVPPYVSKAKYLFPAGNLKLFASKFFSCLNFNLGKMNSVNTTKIEFQNSCKSNICQFDYNRECVESQDCAESIEKNNVQFSIFLSFKGTDSWGIPMTSQNESPLRINPYTMFSFFHKL